jgi:AcrR family transcriptional regulator
MDGGDRSSSGANGRSMRAAQTRARILDSARAVLADQGLERFTTRRVAERAGVSHGMVHYHFDDKRDLMLALAVQARRDWVEPLEELVDGPGSALQRMRAVISWTAEPATREAANVHMSLFIAALRDELVRGRLAAEYERWRAPFVLLFEQLGAEMHLDLDAQRVGDAFASAADGLVQQQCFDPGLDTGPILTALFERLVAPQREVSTGASRTRA